MIIAVEAMGTSFTRIPVPGNWQDFERHTKVLFQCILNDPQTQLNGRAGQAQSGVDIWGRRAGTGGPWVGVQCKGKSQGYGVAVTKTELKEEVEKARTFAPSIAEFILVTTAPNDARIQEVARQITEENEASGKPMSVSVWGWEILEAEILHHGDAIQAFHPDRTPFTDRLMELGDKTLSVASESASEIRQLKEHVESLVREFAQTSRYGGSSADTSSAAKEAVEQHLHREIDGYRDLLNAGRQKTARSALEALKARVWGTATDRVRFRIVTNIAAACLECAEEEEAARRFMEAARYDPQDRVGMANVALAHLLLGEPGEARTAARRALEADPTNAVAAAHLINASKDEPSVTDFFGLVPREARETAEVRASVANVLRQRGDPAWRSVAHEGKGKFPEHPGLQRLAADAVLDQAISSREFELGGWSPDGVGNEEFRNAIAVLQELWSKAREAEGWREDTALPHNLARALWAVEADDAAAAVLDQALARAPDDHALRYLRAGLFQTSDQPDRALEILAEEPDQPGIALLRAQAEIKRSPARARAILDAVRQGAETEHEILAAMLVIDSYLQEGNPVEALAKSTQACADFPERVEPVRKLARVQRLLGMTDADGTLTKAKESVRAETPLVERLLVAEELDATGRSEEAIELLDDRIDRSRDSAGLRTLVRAYINADRRTGAFELVKGLPVNVAELPFYLRALATVHLNRKELSDASKTLDRYLEKRPADLAARLQWVDVALRQDGREDIKAFLEGSVEDLKGSPSCRMRLAQLLDRFGFGSRAFQLAYRVLLQHPNDPQVHLMYAGLFLMPRSITGLEIDRNVIAEDTAFTVETNRGERETYIVEADPKLRMGPQYVTPDGDIATKMRGLAVGGAANWGHGPGRREWRIVEIKHKWLYAAHGTMAGFERYFPGKGGLEQVEFDETKPEPFAEVFQRVKARHDAIQRIFDIYESESLPLHVPARALGSDVIDFRLGLLEAGRKLRVCVGTAPERDAASASIEHNRGRGCVVDALTLFLIRRRRLEETVVGTCGPIHLTETTKDVFRRRAKEFELHPGPGMSLLWQDGRIVRHETSQEAWDEALATRRSDLAWAEAHALTVPAVGSADPLPEIRRVDQAVGGGLVDDLLAAQGADLLFLSDDHVLRTFGVELLGLRASWLQPVLVWACDAGLIDRGRYNELILGSVDAGDEVVSIDKDVLRAAGHGAYELVPGRFKRAAELLGGPQAEMASHLGVAADFVAAIWKERPLELSTEAQTGEILRNILKSRYPNWPTVIAVFRSMLQERHDFSRQIDNYVLRWLQGHFLLAWDATSLPRLE